MSQRMLAHKPSNVSAVTHGASSGLKVNRPGDTFEQEADRVAAVIASGGRIPAWSIGRVGMSSTASTVQRDGPDASSPQQYPKPDNYGDAAKKAAEAFMKTDAGKKLEQAAKDDPLVKGASDFVGTLPGKIIVGAAATATVAALAAEHKPLPLQLPAIPLSPISPKLKDMSVKVDYEGPVDKPTKAMLTFSYTPGADKKKKKDDTSARLKSETQALRASMDMFRPKNDSAHQDDSVHEVAAAEKSRFAPYAKPPAHAPAQQTPLDKKLDLKPAEAAPPIANDKDKKDEAPLQRKASGSEGVLQRKCSCGGSAEADGQCEECKANKQVQRNSTDAGPASAPSSVESVLHSSGVPLDRSDRSFFESRFGLDFSKVRIHTGAQAASSARDVAAKAYTVRDRIVFDSGQYSPHTQEGRRLLAHELTHVVQQMGGSNAAQAPKAPRPVQRKVVRNKAEMEAKDRAAFLKSHKWINPALASQIMEEMAAAGDTFDFADDNELQTEIVKRLSTVRHMKESQEGDKVSGNLRLAFGYPFNSGTEVYGPRVNFAARDYWTPALSDNYAARTDKARVNQAVNTDRSTRHTIFGDQPLEKYFWKLSDKGKADPYTAIKLLFEPQDEVQKRTLIHCDYLISLVNLLSLADSIGKDKFIKRIATFGIDKIVLNKDTFWDMHLETDLRDQAGEALEKKTPGLKSTQRVTPTSPNDLVIGDHVVFHNHSAFDLLNESGNPWRLENAVYVSRDDKGINTYLGHGSGPETESDMRKKLSEEFNKLVDIAQPIVNRAASWNLVIRQVAQDELFRRFNTVMIDDDAVVTGKFHDITCRTNVNFKLHHIGPDEVVGLHDPCNSSAMWPVERPIESAPGKATP